jgi:hypothetical protein
MLQVFCRQVLCGTAVSCRDGGARLTARRRPRARLYRQRHKPRHRSGATGMPCGAAVMSRCRVWLWRGPDDLGSFWMHWCHRGRTALRRRYNRAMVWLSPPCRCFQACATTSIARVGVGGCICAIMALTGSSAHVSRCLACACMAAPASHARVTWRSEALFGPQRARRRRGGAREAMSRLLSRLFIEQQDSISLLGCARCGSWTPATRCLCDLTLCVRRSEGCFTLCLQGQRLSGSAGWADFACQSRVHV